MVGATGIEHPSYVIDYAIYFVSAPTWLPPLLPRKSGLVEGLVPESLGNLHTVHDPTERAYNRMTRSPTARDDARSVGLS